MNRKYTVVLILVFSAFLHTSPSIAGIPPYLQLAQQGQCSQRMGPYQSQYAAQQAARMYQARGYNISGIWGKGGVVSRWSNRRYFFNVFYPC